LDFAFTSSFYLTAAKAWRNSPTFQPVVLGDNFFGLGIRPAFTSLHTVAGEQA